MIRKILNWFKPTPVERPYTKFGQHERKNGDKMTDIEKMDKGFNGKTYSINGIENDF